MATFTFDGTSSVTATKSDTVVITADVTTFTQATDNGSSVTLAFGANTLTITGTPLTAAGLANVSVANGTLNVQGTPIPGNVGINELAFLTPDGVQFTQGITTTASSKVAVFGGLGVNDTIDGNDLISVGGKGTFLVRGAAGNDVITNGKGAFDSTSVVNVFGDQGNDSVDFASIANTKANIFVGGGVGLDTIAVNNTGTTFITGGLDSNDGADSIVFASVSGAAGTSYIYGNGGDDVISVGSLAQNGNIVAAIDSTSTTTVFGGFGSDKILAVGTKATITTIGGEGADSITVVNQGGSTFITGGNPTGSDQSLDGADTITVDGSYGNIAIYGNLGNDVISAQALGVANDTTATTTLSIYGGKGGDTITQTNATATAKNSVFIAGGEDGDTISAIGNGGAVTIYGGISSSDATDGADSITLNATSTGNINIFANAGNDTVSIGALGADSTNTATVYGGGGADSITVGVQAANSQALVLNGNEGPDTFAVAAGKGTTVTVGDFKVSDGDALKLSGLSATTLKVVTGSFQTLQQALDAASTSATMANAKGAAAVAFSGSTYVVTDATGAAHTTFDSANGQAIKLTGITDASTLVNVTSITA